MQICMYYCLLGVDKGMLQSPVKVLADGELWDVDLKA